MELLELLLSLPDLLAFLFYVCKGLWWLLRLLGALVVLIARGIGAAGRAIGRGFLRLLDWLRARERARDFPTASVVIDRTAERAAERAARRDAPHDARHGAPRTLR